MGPNPHFGDLGPNPHFGDLGPNPHLGDLGPKHIFCHISSKINVTVVVEDLLEAYMCTEYNEITFKGYQNFGCLGHNIPLFSGFWHQISFLVIPWAKHC